MLDSGFNTTSLFHVRDWRETVSPEDKQTYDLIDKEIKDIKHRIESNPRDYSDQKLRMIASAIDRLRKDQTRIIHKYDFGRFVKDCFSQTLQDYTDPPTFHIEMYNAYSQSKRVCIVCPRGFAKSTTARIFVTHRVVHKLCTQVLLIGSSEGMASQNLVWIKNQIANNEKLIEIYGELQDKTKWSETEFITQDGVYVVAKGAGQRVRGENRQGRPDLILVDDLEDDEMVSNRDNRAKVMNWFTKAVMPIKSRDATIIAIGTILDNDSLLKNIALNKIKDHIPWKVLWYQSLYENEDGTMQSLWPAMRSVEELLAIKEADPEAFSQEYQNNPSSGQMKVFRREWYRHYKPEDIQITPNGIYHLGDKLNVMLTSDFAVSEKQGSDYTVLLVSGMDHMNFLYLLEYTRFRTSDPYEMVKEMFLLVKKWGIEYVSIETNVFQQTFARTLEREMEKENMFFFVNEIHRPSTSNKLQRIKSIAPPVRLGKLLWLEDMVDFEDEMNQVTTTRLGKHDDVLDVVVDAYQLQTEETKDMEHEGAPPGSIEYLFEQGYHPTVAEQMSSKRRQRRREQY